MLFDFANLPDQGQLAFLYESKSCPHLPQCSWTGTLIKKIINFSSYIRKFRMEQLQSHIHSKKFWHGRIFICTLHGGHLQICFSENTYWHAMAEELENHYLYQQVTHWDGGNVWGCGGGGTPSRAALPISDETFRNYFSYLNRSAMLKRLDT